MGRGASGGGGRAAPCGGAGPADVAINVAAGERHGGARRQVNRLCRARCVKAERRRGDGRGDRDPVHQHIVGIGIDSALRGERAGHAVEPGLGKHLVGKRDRGGVRGDPAQGHLGCAGHIFRRPEVGAGEIRVVGRDRRVEDRGIRLCREYRHDVHLLRHVFQRDLALLTLLAFIQRDGERDRCDAQSDALRAGRLDLDRPSLERKGVFLEGDLDPVAARRTLLGGDAVRIGRPAVPVRADRPVGTVERERPIVLQKLLIWIRGGVVDLKRDDGAVVFAVLGQREKQIFGHAAVHIEVRGRGREAVGDVVHRDRHRRILRNGLLNLLGVEIVDDGRAPDRDLRGGHGDSPQGGDPVLVALELPAHHFKADRVALVLGDDLEGGLGLLVEGPPHRGGHREIRRPVFSVDQNLAGNGGDRNRDFRLDDRDGRARAVNQPVVADRGDEHRGFALLDAGHLETGALKLDRGNARIEIDALDLADDHRLVVGLRDDFDGIADRHDPLADERNGIIREQRPVAVMEVEGRGDALIHDRVLDDRRERVRTRGELARIRIGVGRRRVAELSIRGGDPGVQRRGERRAVIELRAVHDLIREARAAAVTAGDGGAHGGGQIVAVGHRIRVVVAAVGASCRRDRIYGGGGRLDPADRIAVFNCFYTVGVVGPVAPSAAREAGETADRAGVLRGVAVIEIPAGIAALDQAEVCPDKAADIGLGVAVRGTRGERVGNHAAVFDRAHIDADQPADMAVKRRRGRGIIRIIDRVAADHAVLDRGVRRIDQAHECADRRVGLIRRRVIGRYDFAGGARIGREHHDVSEGAGLFVGNRGVAAGLVVDGHLTELTDQADESLVGVIDVAVILQRVAVPVIDPAEGHRPGAAASDRLKAGGDLDVVRLVVGVVAV